MELRNCCGQEISRYGFILADMNDPRMRTLHTTNHGPEFVRAVSRFIEKVKEARAPSVSLGAITRYCMTRSASAQVKNKSACVPWLRIAVTIRRSLLCQY